MTATALAHWGWLTSAVAVCGTGAGTTWVSPSRRNEAAGGPTHVGDRMDDLEDGLGVRRLERRAVRLRKEAGNLDEEVGSELELGRRVHLQEARPQGQLPLQQVLQQSTTERTRSSMCSIARMTVSSRASASRSALDTVLPVVLRPSLTPRPSSVRKRSVNVSKLAESGGRERSRRQILAGAQEEGRVGSAPEGRQLADDL